MVNVLFPSVVLFGPSAAVASLLSFAVQLLAKHPKVQAAARAHVQAARDRAGLRVGEPLPHQLAVGVQYLLALLLEVQRCQPLFLHNVPTLASHSMRVAGALIPKGASVAVDVRALNEDPASWSEPTKFDPERHREIGEEAATHEAPQAHHGPDQTQPSEPPTHPLPPFLYSSKSPRRVHGFGVGGRYCLAQHLVRGLFCTLVAGLVDQFEISAVAPPDPAPVAADGNTTTTNGGGSAQPHAQRVGFLHLPSADCNVIVKLRQQ